MFKVKTNKRRAGCFISLFIYNIYMPHSNPTQLTGIIQAQTGYIRLFSFCTLPLSSKPSQEDKTLKKLQNITSYTGTFEDSRVQRFCYLFHWYVQNIRNCEVKGCLLNKVAFWKLFDIAILCHSATKLIRLTPFLRKQDGVLMNARMLSLQQRKGTWWQKAVFVI